MRDSVFEFHNTRKKFHNRIVTISGQGKRARSTEIVINGNQRWEVFPTAALWEALLFCKNSGANAVLLPEGIEDETQSLMLRPADLKLTEFESGRFFVSTRMPLPFLICDDSPEGENFLFIHYLKHNRVVAQLRSLLHDLGEWAQTPGQDSYIFHILQQDFISEKSSAPEVGERFRLILGPARLLHLILPRLIVLDDELRATQAVEDALFIAPEDRFVRLSAAKWYYSIQNLSLAREFLEDAATENDKHPLYLFFAFECAIAAFDLPMARMLLDYLARRFTTCYVTKLSCGIYFSAIKNREMALKYLFECFELAPHDLLVSSQICQILRDLQKPQLASAVQSVALNNVISQTAELSPQYKELMIRQNVQGAA